MDAVINAKLQVVHHGIRRGEIHDHLDAGVDKLLQVVAVVNFSGELEVVSLFHSADYSRTDAALRAENSNLDHAFPFR